MRVIEKGDFMPEYVATGGDGHFSLGGEQIEMDVTNHTTHLVPHRNDWDRPCNHPKQEDAA